MGANEETIVWWYEAFKLAVIVLAVVCFAIAIVGKIMQRGKKGAETGQPGDGQP